MIWTPHAQYYVDDVALDRPEPSWFQRVMRPAIIKAILTAIALAVLFLVIAAIVPDRRNSPDRDCPAGGCPSGQGWSPF